MVKANNSDMHLYAIALGSNRPLSRSLPPPAILHAALALLDLHPFRLLSAAPVIISRPIGPSLRAYANSVALVESALTPREMLAALQALESDFGRKRARRWGERTLDLDIVLWSGGRFSYGRKLIIPHKAWDARDFVLAPLTSIASTWRDPWSMSPVHAKYRQLIRPKPVDRSASRL